jgi:hypothetical protein
MITVICSCDQKGYTLVLIQAMVFLIIMVQDNYSNLQL